MKTAVGNNKDPDRKDFDCFLCERRIPKTRDELNFYLEQIGVSRFDPFEIILVIKGTWQRTDSIYRLRMSDAKL